MKLKIFFISSFLILFCVLDAHSIDKSEKKQTSLGFFWANGFILDWGETSNDYTKEISENAFEVGAFYKLHSTKNSYSLMFEFVSRYLNTNYVFSTGEPGINKQINQGFNFKIGKNFLSSSEDFLYLYFGPGIYAVSQKRIPEPALTNISEIDDGIASYLGMSIEFEITGSVPFHNGRMGLSTRIFLQPPFYIASKSNVPKFYHQGVTIGWHVEF